MLILLMILITFSGTILSCKPSVEGETYVFRHVFKHVLEEPLELVWSRNSIPISTCRRNLACYDYNAGKTVTTLRKLVDGLFETNHTIGNLTKSNAGTMYLKYLGLASLIHSQPLFNCTLFVYTTSVLTLKDCHDSVEEGTEVKCLCKKKDDSLETFRLHWFNHNGKLMNNESPMLSFVARRNDLGYTCRGLRSDGVESMPLEYRPIIINRAYEKRLIYVQESSCSFEDILISSVTIFVLFLVVLVAFYYSLTKGSSSSKTIYRGYRDSIKNKKLPHSLDYSVTSELKPYLLLKTKSLDKNTNFRPNGDKVSLYFTWQTNDFNIINDSEDSEGYASMSDEYR